MSQQNMPSLLRLILVRFYMKKMRLNRLKLPLSVNYLLFILSMKPWNKAKSLFLLRWKFQIIPTRLTTNSEASNVPMEARNYTVEELLEATLVSSANSAAIALAEKVAGSEKDFVDMMKANFLNGEFKMLPSSIQLVLIMKLLGIISIQVLRKMTKIR